MGRVHRSPVTLPFVPLDGIAGRTALAVTIRIIWELCHNAKRLLPGRHNYCWATGQHCTFDIDRNWHTQEPAARLQENAGRRAVTATAGWEHGNG